MASNRTSDTKNATLRNHHALNPHPENVTDELFTQLEFFDPSDLVQVKYEMLRRVWKDEWPVARAARTFGFSRNAFYKAQAAFEREGITGLLRQRPGPRAAHKLTDRVMAFIEEAQAQDASLRAAELQQLIHEHFRLSIHRRSIERALKRRKKKGSRQSGKRSSPGARTC